MLGREAEWEQIERGLAALPKVRVVIALEGGPGVGKTTLWQAGIDHARRHGLSVRATAPGEPDAGLAFAGLGDLLDRLPDGVGDGLPEPQARALARALTIGGDTDAAPESGALLRAVLTVLRVLALRAPLLVAIDDEHWLDPPTARALAFALPRLRDVPLGVLMTRRPATDGALWREVADEHRREGVLRIRVNSLDESAIDDLVTRRLGRRLPSRLRRRIYESSGGNPLYALAIAREVHDRGVHGAEVPIPRTLSAAIRQRLDGLGEAARTPLLAVAAASHPTLAVIQAVTDGFALSDLDDAVDAEVVEIGGNEIRFTHPLLASTLYADAPPAQRRATHRRLAHVIEDEQQRARHLALGAEAADSQTAAAIEQGAAVAHGRGAPDIAAELLEEAARLTPADMPELARLRLIRAAELHDQGGDLARCRALLTSLLPTVPTGPVRARALLALAVATDDFGAGERLLDEALANASDHDRLRVRILLYRGGSSSNRGDWAAMTAYTRRALAAAERAGDPALIAHALADVCGAEFFTGQRVNPESLRRALELEDPNEGTCRDSASGAVARIAFWSDDYAAGRPALERVIQRGRDHAEHVELGALLFELSLLEWYAGDVERAELLQAAARDWSVSDQPDDALWLVCGEAMFAARRGDLDHAREAADRALATAQANNDLLIGAFPTIVLGALDLWTGQAALAHDRLHALRTSFTDAGFGFLGALTIDMWATDVEALIVLDRLDEAQEVADDLAARARTVANPNAQAIAHRCHGLVLAARGDIPAALEQMNAALAAHQQRLLRPEHARTLLEHGSLLRRAKQKNAAKHSLDHALAIYQQIGARLWAQRSRDELSRIGLKRPTPSGLTPAQTRVVELACAGHTNQHIATTLYMSPRSVEAHLTKAYRHYGVKNRAQLIATIAAQTAEEAAVH